MILRDIQKTYSIFLFTIGLCMCSFQWKDNDIESSKKLTSIASLTNKSCSLTLSDYLLCCGPYVTEETMLSLSPYIGSLSVLKLYKTENLIRLSKGVFNHIVTRSMILSDNLAFEKIEKGAFSIVENLENLTISNYKFAFVSEENAVWDIFIDTDGLKYLNLSNNCLTNVSFSYSKELELLPNLKILIMDSNPIVSMDKNFFKPIIKSKLQTISLSSCKLMHIQSDTFKYFTNLKTLVLDDNSELFAINSFLTHPLKFPMSVTSLSIGYNEIKFNMTKIVIHRILKSLPKLNLLDLSGNFLNPITSDLFIKHTNIRKILLSDCKLSSMSREIFSLFRSIQEIDLRNNYLKRIPESLISSELKILKIGRPRLSQYVDNFVISPNITSIPSIEELNFNYLSFNIKSVKAIGYYSPNLKFLKYQDCYLQFNEFNRSLKERGQIFKSQFPNLKILSLKNSKYTPNYYFKFEDFHGMKHLEELDLTGNVIVPNEKPKETMYESKLKKLYLSSSLKFRLEDYHIEEDFKHLETIDLSNNDIDTCDNHTAFFNWTSHPQLTSLIIRKNRVPFCLTEEMTQLFCRLQYLDMTETLFKCSEAISYFYIISLKCPVKIINFQGGNGYFCQRKSDVIPFLNYLTQSTGDETFIPSFNKNKITQSNQLLTIFLIGGIFLMTLLIMIAVYFKVRSNWLYLMFIVTKQNEKLRSQFNQKTIISEKQNKYSFEYDAFLSYDSLDEKWIDEDLLPNVENNSKLKLCVHTRDFIPGKSIAQNIVESLEKSRKCIIILSDSYLQSKWCQFEYQLAYDLMQRQSFRDLILVKKGLQATTKSRMIRELKYFLCTHTYLEWREDFNEKKKKDFWTNLHKSLIKH